MSQDTPMVEASKRTKSQVTLTMLSNKKARAPAQRSSLQSQIVPDGGLQEMDIQPTPALQADQSWSAHTDMETSQDDGMDCGGLTLPSTPQLGEPNTLPSNPLPGGRSSVVSIQTDNTTVSSITSPSHSPGTHRTQGILRSPLASGPTILHTRFQIVMNLSKVTDGFYTVYARRKLLKILSDIQRFDRQVRLLAWERDERSSYPAIDLFSDESPLSSVLMHFTKYVSAFRIPRENQKKEVWAKIFLSHTCTTNNLIQNIQEVLQVDSWNLSVCRLQVEKSKTIGWLLYSLRHHQEDNRLVNEFSDRFGHPVAVYWRKISGFETSTKTNQHALHVEVPTEYASAAVRFFTRLYGSGTNSDTWPLHYRMNLIPEHSRLAQGQQVQSRKLCLRQSKFCQDHQTATMYSLTAPLNTVISDKAGHTTTICKALLSIVMPSTTLPVFHSVTLNKRGEVVVSTFQYAHSYGRMIVSSPLTFLKFFYEPTSIEQCFSEEEIDRSKAEYMNPETLEVVTEEVNLMNLAQELDGYGGIIDAELIDFMHPAHEQREIKLVNVPTYLQTYHNTNTSGARSVDFRLSDYRSQNSDGDSTLGESMVSTAQRSDIRDVTHQVLVANLGRAAQSVQSQVPFSVATDKNSFQIQQGKSVGGRGR